MSMSLEAVPSSDVVGPVAAASLDPVVPAIATMTPVPETVEFAVTLQLPRGTTVTLKFNDEDKKKIHELHTRIARTGEVIDLQNVSNTDSPEVKQMRELVTKVLGNRHFKWSHRPANVRGNMNGSVPYSQKADSVQNWKWKGDLTPNQMKAHTMVDKWKEALTKKRDQLDQAFKQHPEHKYLQKDVETVSQMLARLQAVKLAAVDFEMEHPFLPTTVENLHKTIEERKEIALKLIVDQHSSWKNLKDKVVGNSDEMAEIDFAYDLAMQGISDQTIPGKSRRQVYDMACSIIDIEPKQDTLEFSIIQAAKDLPPKGGQLNDAALNTRPLAEFFDRLSEQTRDALRNSFIVL